MEPKPPLRRCAVYTRKSSEEGLEQRFNSLDAQREAGVAYIQSQAQEGWQVVKTTYDDGGYSGATIERPALQQLLEEIRVQRIQVVVVYKVDRLTRSLSDFAKLIDLFDQHGVAFASVTQQFQTTTSMGRLVLNVLLSFAQFEREVTGERIRDKIAASKKKGWWMGGVPPLGYDVEDRHLIINEAEAIVVQHIFHRYLTVGSVSSLVQELRQDGTRTKVYRSRAGRVSGGRPFSRGHLYHLLHNRLYRGEIVHRDQVYPGNHLPIIDEALWQQTQALLKANCQAWHKDTNVQTPFLLKGRLFDSHGNRFSPMQGRKGSRTYRYYVSQVVLQFREVHPEGIRRIPAAPLEQAVTNAVLQALKKDDVTRVWVSKLETLNETELHAVWRLWLTRVDVSAARLRIFINPTENITFDSSQSEALANAGWEIPLARVVEVPWVMVQRGGQTDIQGQGGVPQIQSQPNEALVTALVRACQWKEDLVAGRVSTVKALAQREGVDSSYVRRILRLSFLSPDLIEAILNGWHPPELTLEQFRRPIPMEWAKQLQYLRFPPSP